MKLSKFILLFLSVALLAACQPDVSSDSYDYYGGTSGKVRKAVIEDIQHNVTVRKSSQGGGALVGGFAGAVVGGSLAGGGRRGPGRAIGTIGGAVVGGLAGHAIENSAGSAKATLYIIRLKNSGRMLSVIQQSRLPLCKGDHVYLIGSNDRPRLKLNDNYYSDGKHSRTGCF
jgi:outer membrane lipoprotein SlyB